jgi:hypothetical protein
MTPKKLLSAATLAFLLSAGIAGAQTTPNANQPDAYQTGTVQTGTTGTGTGGTGTTGTTGTGGTGTTDSTSTLPGTPNTGLGGDMAANVLLLGSSAVIALAGILYLVTQRTRKM